MNRDEILLSMFDPTGFGLEVGPSYNPFLPKAKGYNVETIDHADAATLREKYRDNAFQIEEVDYISDGRSMAEIIGGTERYDFVFASHVIEHVTDIVRFLQDCETLLKPSGRLVLAVPDKRFCFDVLRPLTTVGQALQAYAEKRQRHPAGVLYDHFSYFCEKDGHGIWVTPDLNGVDLVKSSEEARQIFEMAQSTPDYHDAHAWQFTPSSFRFLVKKLRDLGYIKSGEAGFHKHAIGELGMHEFYVTLSKSAARLPVTDMALIKQAEAELREVRL
ncbi:class I SAM-dependent methyltransferase [Mesorhizobium sp. J8]|uniref:class I SAM-dependent methyltransferase n=1 Tax=Mesorhizobium sp. J8 TaxID=2777475 RepID=UPI0019159282|nr:methyltransferase domain-containing protein [Mesorhizobium sp. J8]BCM18238.1 ubiquinone biosynthesis O-methyltransferase [Mesorhizobium sp. J8]